tara:strand:+ start:192 stop:608 length:417 start_codon:yes stop_codon:yes gene_type:complete
MVAKLYRGKGLSKVMAVEVDLDVIRQLASIGCSYDEIGARFGLTGPQFKKRKDKDEQIREAYIEGMSEGKISIRRAMHHKAVDKLDFPAMRWLAMNRLDQREYKARDAEPEVQKVGSLRSLIERSLGKKSEDPDDDDA